jgi:hypothetical protein
VKRRIVAALAIIIDDLPGDDLVQRVAAVSQLEFL